MVRIILLVARCLGAIPLPARALLGRWIGRFVYLIPTRDRKVAELQLQLILGQEGGAVHLPDVYSSVVETLLESMNLRPLIDNYTRYVTADWQQWDEILQRRKGVLILSAHTGNWDFLAACSVKHGFKVSVVGRAAKNSGFQETLRRLREEYGVKTIWRSGNSGVKQIIEGFKKGEAVAALIDQDTRVASLTVPFFGRPAATPATMVELAKKYGVVIIAPFIFRLSTNHYRIYVSEFDNNLPTAEILRRFNESLEKLIRQYPAQWVWFHKRWRSLPGGKRLSTNEYIEYLKAQLESSGA